MSTSKIVDFKNEEKFITFKGERFKVADRTIRVENKVAEVLQLSKVPGKILESYDEAFKLFLGDEAAEKIMVDGEDSNIDLLDTTLEAVLEMYYSDKNQRAKKKIANSMKEIKPLVDAATSASKLKNEAGN